MSSDDDARSLIAHRRAKLIASATLGLMVPLGVVTCAPPRPCLSQAIPRLARIGADGAFSVTPSEAANSGLPAVTFSFSIAGTGLLANDTNGDDYASTSGPPGGPLGFRVRAYRRTNAESLEDLIRALLSEQKDTSPLFVGHLEAKLKLGGQELEAQAFRTGEGPASTLWCLAKLPTNTQDLEGALFVFAAGAPEQTAITCEQTLAHPAFVKLLASMILGGVQVAEPPRPPG